MRATEHARKRSGILERGTSETFAFLCGMAATLAVYVILKSVGSKAGELEARDARRLGIAGTILIAVCMAYILVYEYSHWHIL